MSDAPDVSVIISTLNRRTSLLRNLDSLEHQIVPAALEYEIIVVDNGCSDGTRAAVESLIAQGSKRLRYVFEPRPGVSFGRNTGAAVARAPIVAFTDDDNIVASDWVAKVKALLDADPDVAAVGGRIVPEWPAEVPSWLDRQHWPPIALLDYDDTRFYTSATNPRCLLTANLAFRREVLERLGGFSPVFVRCQDHELLMRLWRSGGRALYASELVVRAPIDPQRLTIKYHRAWHVRHGCYSALMRSEEVIDKSGCLRLEPANNGCPFGVPVHLYAELVRAAVGSVAGWVRRRHPLSPLP
jgi:glucosyl-dolichyl phosphate glucuronosyltransferase